MENITHLLIQEEETRSRLGTEVVHMTCFFVVD